MTNKLLFAGCSFTAECGFTKENAAKYHWPILLSKHYDSTYTNIAIGGMSNDEIFYRLVEASTHAYYDLIIVNWSSIGRKWVYYSDKNIDDFTVANHHNMLNDVNFMDEELKKYLKLHYSYFDNHYIALKHWLLQINALQNIFSNKNQKYIFIKGFSNYIAEVSKVKFLNEQFVMFSEELKKLFDFHNRPDYYILEKINVLKSLIETIDRSKWINFDGLSFLDMQIDYADDQSHPGAETNKLLVNKLIEHIDTNNLLNIESI
jgi:hypothetical protein